MDELNVIFRNTHGNYYYGEGLCYVLRKHPVNSSSQEFSVS